MGAVKNKFDSLRIAVSGNGQFQGYLKSVSVFNNKIETTLDKSKAKCYAKQESAMKDIYLANQITRGTLSFQPV